MKKLRLIFLFLTIPIFSQEKTDSLIYKPIIDSLSTSLDTIQSSDSGLDAIVEYSAKDSAVFDINNKQMKLYGEGELKYKEYDLKAARIVLFQEDATLESFGIPDTAKDGKYTGTPVFYEGSKRYDAFKLRYNFNSKKGTISMGSTEIEGGYYSGEKIKKVDEDIFFVKNGRYTTCEKEDADYYFGSPKMKIIQSDKVIGEPVYLYIDDVPIFAIPFGIFPNHSGRSSGLIPPAYGEDFTYGRYFSHLGYFWAINDFLDLALQGNYFTGGRVDLNGRFRYTLRYKFSGQVDVGGSRIRIGEATDADKIFSDEWNISAIHNQSIDPTTNISANLNFVSSKTYFDNSSNNLNQLLRQNAISNFTVSKYWEGTPNSLSLNYYRDQNLVTGEVTENLPSLAFTRSQTFPFRTKNTSLLDLKWYESISFSYNSQLMNRRTKSLQKDASGNSTGIFIKDSHAGLKQSIVITVPLKVSEFTFSPFINYFETWYNKYITKSYNLSDSSVQINYLSGFKAFRNFNLGISTSTRLIGLFKTSFLGVKGFRHTIIPSVTYTFQPDFSKPQWDIWGSYTDASNNEVKYPFFENEVFGFPGRGENQSINLGVGNLFEMKVKDTDSSDSKFQLLNLNAGISYNFVADSLKFSEVTLSYRTQVGNFLNIGGGASFNLYKYVDSVGRINQFLWKTDRKLAQLTSFNVNISTTLQGNQETKVNDTTKTKPIYEEYYGIYNDAPADFSIPWSVTFNYNYSLTKNIPSVITKSSNLSTSLAFSLTKSWKFTFTTGYDVFQKKFSAPYVTIYRDLHCWEMNFSWVPTGSYRGFKFEIRIKAPQLHDVKVTKQTNFRGVYY